MPILVIRHPHGNVEERELIGKLTVGSDDGNDLVLRESGISGRHAQFTLEAGEVVLENLGTSATLIDSIPMGPPTKLLPEMKVLLGLYEISLKPESPPPRRRKLPAWKIAATFGLAAFLAAVIWEAWPAAPPALAEPRAAGSCQDVESMLRLARGGFDQRALAGANAALACEPSNKEAAELKRQIDAELELAAKRRAARDAGVAGGGDQ